MMTATISSKFQLVVPKEVRQAAGLYSGQKIAFVLVGHSLHLVPVEHIDALRGVARGVGEPFVRDRAADDMDKIDGR